ncbi:SERAC1 [Lepeophtheirus salmonis]|uniref:SERAC1 n=1 Tax=Lepeophtheirus salmonis TaxID=72036 RepID=A0A7R8CGK5_LEPSM|nr:SERAC1 [Lepeophtheirus salmonis]CAF2811699.1 SERAC1 [Lepeophtheirus salmonis]
MIFELRHWVDLKKPHWKLLRESNSMGPLHAKAVKELAKIKNLSPGVYAQIAQAVCMETAVGLARCQDADPRFFLVMFYLFYPEGKNGDDRIHPCIDQFTKEALQKYVPQSDDDHVTDSDLSYEFHRESHHIYAIPRKRYTEEMLIEYCLQALLSHSTLQSHCQILLEKTLVLPLFQRLLKEYPDRPKVKCLIGKIIANMSLHPKFHKILFTSGWVGILAKWKQDPNLLINLPATKALCNMDQKYLKHKYEPGVYLMLPHERNIDANVDVVFIHGLLGGVFFSWRQGDPKNERGGGDWITNDIDSEVRILGIDFDTYLSQWGGPCPNESFSSSLEERSNDILKKLKECGVGQNGKRVIFVGHSMGGIIIKKMILNASASADEEDLNFVKNTRGIIFYGTPHQGSDVATLNATSKFIFFPSTEVRELAAGSPVLANIHSNFIEWTKQQSQGYKPPKIVSFGEVESTSYLGFDLTFVPEKSSNPGIGEFYPVKTNHMNICKPDSQKSILYRKLMSTLWEVQDEQFS